jgi:hypothetical protein
LSVKLARYFWPEGSDVKGSCRAAVKIVKGL